MKHLHKKCGVSESECHTKSTFLPHAARVPRDTQYMCVYAPLGSTARTPTTPSRSLHQHAQGVLSEKKHPHAPFSHGYRVSSTPPALLPPPSLPVCLRQRNSGHSPSPRTPPDSYDDPSEVFAHLSGDRPTVVTHHRHHATEGGKETASFANDVSVHPYTYKFKFRSAQRNVVP